MQSWSFGILCYNEAGTLERVYRDVVTLVSEWQLDDYEILIIDDGSQDETPAIIHRLAAQDPRILPIIHPNRRSRTPIPAEAVAPPKRRSSCDALPRSELTSSVSASLRLS